MIEKETKEKLFDFIENNLDAATKFIAAIIIFNIFILLLVNLLR